MLKSHAPRAMLRAGAVLTALVIAASWIVPAFGADPLPPPSNLGTGIPLTYQGPPPSEVDRSLVGPVKLLRAGTAMRCR